jgi:hypothetical protein
MRLRNMGVEKAEAMLKDLYDSDGNMVSGVISTNKIPDVPNPATLVFINGTDKNLRTFYNPPEYSPSQTEALRFFASRNQSAEIVSRFQSKTITGVDKDQKAATMTVFILQDPLCDGRVYEEPPNTKISLLCSLGAVMAVCPQAQVNVVTHQRFEYDGFNDAILNLDGRYLYSWDLLSQFWIDVGTTAVCYSAFVNSQLQAWIQGIQAHVGLCRDFGLTFLHQRTQNLIENNRLSYLAMLLKKAIIGYVRLLDTDWASHFRCLCPPPEIFDTADIVADYCCTVCLYVSATVNNIIV